MHHTAVAANRCNSLSALQHAATHCNKHQHTAATSYHAHLYVDDMSALQRTATHCNALQRTATH